MSATLDGWRRHMAEQGHELLGTALRRAERIRAEDAGLPGLRESACSTSARGASPGTRSVSSSA
ncbi:hypothetical protein [Streptomyces djakartensis]|uniref:hypothetical protein n=1 Tax=Streptomyces djakartensis TaxID=68193 RepID=UPI0034DFC643